MLKSFDVNVEPYQYEYLQALVMAWRTQEYNYEIQPQVKQIEDCLEEIKAFFDEKRK